MCQHCVLVLHLLYLHGSCEQEHRHWVTAALLARHGRPPILAESAVQVMMTKSYLGMTFILLNRSYNTVSQTINIQNSPSALYWGPTTGGQQWVFGVRCCHGLLHCWPAAQFMGMAGGQRSARSCTTHLARLILLPGWLFDSSRLPVTLLMMSSPAGCIRCSTSDQYLAGRPACGLSRL